MGEHGNTVRVICTYLVLLVAGQATAVGIGLFLDTVSRSAALTAFILIYYAMYWVAWRLALLIADRTPEPQLQAAGSSGSAAKLGAWLLAPALLTFGMVE